jgi:hypothetical protein
VYHFSSTLVATTTNVVWFMKVMTGEIVFWDRARAMHGRCAGGNRASETGGRVFPSARTGYPFLFRLICSSACLEVTKLLGGTLSMRKTLPPTMIPFQ